ncbi:MAG: hypothetical protein S4CHLAM7_10650 [Chlamydiae bacterium]|nr:hypothetical protein [Chlamydiota bacterium]
MATITTLARTYTLLPEINSSHNTIVDIKEIPPEASKFIATYQACITSATDCETVYENPFLTFTIDFASIKAPCQFSYNAIEPFDTFINWYQREQKSRINRPEQLIDSIQQKAKGLTKEEVAFLVKSAANESERLTPMPIQVAQITSKFVLNNGSVKKTGEAKVLLPAIRHDSKGLVSGKHIRFCINQESFTKKPFELMFYKITDPPPHLLSTRNVTIILNIKDQLSKKSADSVSMNIYPDSLSNSPCSNITLPISKPNQTTQMLTTAASVLHICLTFSRKPDQLFSKELDLNKLLRNDDLKVEITSVKKKGDGHKKSVQISYFTKSKPEKAPEWKLLKLENSTSKDLSASTQSTR